MSLWTPPELTISSRRSPVVTDDQPGISAEQFWGDPDVEALLARLERAAEKL